MKKGLYALLPLAGLMMAAMSPVATAGALGGNLNMKASLAEETCVIEGLNDSIVFPEVLSTGTYTDWQTISYLKHTIKATNCPASISSIKITPTYTGGTAPKSIETTGSSHGASLYLAAQGAVPTQRGLLVWNSGETVSLKVAHGAAAYTPIAVIKKNTEELSAGDFSGNVQFTVDYE